MQVSPTVYPVTANVVDWMSHTLNPLHQSTFTYYRSMRRLLTIVDLCEAGGTTRRVADGVIKRYNRVHRAELCGREISYEEVRDRCSKYLFLEAGEKWEAYSDNPARLISGQYDNPEESFYLAAEDVNWALMWLTSEDTLIVYRSPHVGYRRQSQYSAEVIDVPLCDGLSGGDKSSFTLPPGIEGAIRQDQGV